MTEFRDAIERTVQMSPIYTGGVIADEVLAMPEMQAIRILLAGVIANMNDPKAVFAYYGVPESVIAWVLDEGSNP